jgi:PQQ-like domain/Abnormal spindle-like microcephaly-assoc'd, ASPM-SPD-2-Hydin
MLGRGKDSNRAIRRSSPGARVLARLGALLVVVALSALASAAGALGEGVTNSGDDLRDGWYPEQASLTPQLVSGGSFGQLWSTPVDGQVYGQPLLAGGSVVIVTENDKVYALDPATGALRWPGLALEGTPWKGTDIGCSDITPNVGITSTPVVDTSTNTIYLTHKAYASGSSGPARWYMDAIDLTKGTEKKPFPVELSGAAQNVPGDSFEPTHQLQRPGLLLMNGVVYAGFGSQCDVGPWQGWIFGVSTSGAIKARWIAVPKGWGAGIWQSGSGLVSDKPGSLMFATGNLGSPSSPAAGNSPPSTLGESIVRLAVQPDGSLNAVNFFSPFNNKELDEHDLDFASSGITALNDNYFGTLSFPHLLLTAGKQGYVYLLNREELGGFQQAINKGDKVIQRIGPYGGVWARPAVWPGDGGWFYIPSSYTGGALRVYQYGVSGTGEPTISLQATSTDSFGFSSSSAIVTSNGAKTGSALVWIVWTSNNSGSGAQLRAYDPVPVAGHPALRWSAAIGTSSRFAMPGAGAGRIYVGTRDEKVLAFGSPVTAPLTGPATEFPTTTLGQSSEKTLTLTATKALTVNKLTSSNSQFIVGTTSPPLPATLSAGQTIQVPLTFKPTQTGLVGGTLSAETTQGEAAFSMSGTGQASGAQLSVSPKNISYGGISAGNSSSSSATFSNTGSSPLKINAEQLPAAPFTVAGMPKIGSEIAPGASVTVTVTFEPTHEGKYSDELGMETTGGNGAVLLSGSAGPPGKLQITSENNEFGEVPVGKTVSKSFTIQNVGGINVSISKSKPPAGGAFTPTTTLSEGTTLAPGESVVETVSFTPTAPGLATGVWAINGTDSTGLHEVKFSGIGLGTFGKTSVGASTDTFLADRKRVNRYALPSAGSVSKLSIYLAPTSTKGEQVLKGVVYSDAGGKPETLLGSTEQFTFKSTNAAGWYDLTFPSPLKLAAGNYWIGAISGATGGVAGWRFDSVTGSRDYNANTYASGPSNPFGAVTTDAKQASLYATYAPAQVSVPVNTGAPTITGIPEQGETLTEHNGSWTNEPTGFTYHWLQCDEAGNNCKPIAGQEGQSYVPVAGDVGKTIKVEETASNGAGAGKPATSLATAVIGPPVPTNQSPPMITGEARQGETLNEHHGAWTNEPTGFTYHWLQCDEAGKTCKPITGAEGQSYVLLSGDVGHTIRVEETASNASGPSSPATSVATAVVVPPKPKNIEAPTITGTAQQAQTLTEHNGKWTNEPTKFAYQWLQCNNLGEGCLPIGGAKAQTYAPTASDVGHTIEVEETASNAGGPGEPATSKPTAVIAPPPPPSNTTAPAIKGTAQQGQILTAENGSWTNEPTKFEYRWLRCDPAGEKCAAIAEATAKTYTLTSADVGFTIRVEVSAENGGGKSSFVSSPQTAVVTEKAVAPKQLGKTSVGGSSDTFKADRKRVNRYALAEAGTVSKLSIYLAPTKTAGQQVLKGVIYSDVGGKPEALLAVSEQLTFKNTNAAGFYDLPLAAPLKLAPGNYWLGVITGATSGVAGFRYDSVASSRDYNANTYTSGPSNPFGAVTTDAEQASLYATYTPG